jgi:calpain-15
MVASTHQSSSKVQTGKGLYAQHAYTCLGAYKLDGDMVVKLRNPHGKGEWTGDWSDDDSNWNDKLRKQVGMVNGEDGTFFMPIDSFRDNFCAVTVCHYRPHYVYTAFKASGTYLSGLNGFEVDITQPGEYYFSLSKVDQRFMDVTKQPYTSMCVLKKEGNSYKYLGGKAHIERDPFVMLDCQPGQYIFVVSCKF